MEEVGSLSITEHGTTFIGQEPSNTMALKLELYRWVAHTTADIDNSCLCKYSPTQWNKYITPSSTYLARTH